MSKNINSLSLKKKNKCSGLFTPINTYNFLHELRAKSCKSKLYLAKNHTIDMIDQV